MPNALDDTFSLSDMRNALFLEQAAYCYLGIQYPHPMIRKYAFFLSLAGHRFNKAAQVTIKISLIYYVIFF